MTKSLATVFSLGRVEIFTREAMRTILETVTDKCIGQMEVSTRVNGKMEFSMEEVILFLFQDKFTFQDKD